MEVHHKRLVQEQYGDLEKGLLELQSEIEIGYSGIRWIGYAETPTWADIVEVVNDKLLKIKQINNFGDCRY